MPLLNVNNRSLTITTVMVSTPSADRATAHRLRPSSQHVTPDALLPESLDRQVLMFLALREEHAQERLPHLCSRTVRCTIDTMSQLNREMTNGTLNVGFQDDCDWGHNLLKGIHTCGMMNRTASADVKAPQFSTLTSVHKERASIQP